MRHRRLISFISGTAVLLCVFASPAWGQGYGQPLTMQGIEDQTLHSVASRAQGGLSFGLSSEPSLMFRNPASLSRIDGITFSISGVQTTVQSEQVQQWFPLRNFPTFSLMMEGLLDKVRDPDLSDLPPDGLIGPEDSIPRPFDSIDPNWTSSRNRTLPLQVSVAVPLELAGIPVQVGLGFVQYANLDYTFQNNNVLSPSIGSQRPYTIPLPAIGQETPVLWSRSRAVREGVLYGYGGAISAELFDGFTAGASVLLLNGSSDDAEETVARGRIRFGNNNNVYYYRLDSVLAVTSSTGSSDYSGYDAGVAASFSHGPFTVGVQVHLPTTIERTASVKTSVDTTGTATVTTRSVKDKVTLPLRGSAGLSLRLRDDLAAGLEYELRPYANAEYTGASGSVTNPWLSSSVFRAGATYTPFSWLALRGGYRNQAFTFEQEGTALVGEPIRFSVYAAGFGISLLGARLDVTYEYSDRHYQDMWQTNVNLNRSTHQSFFTSLTYIIH